MLMSIKTAALLHGKSLSGAATLVRNKSEFLLIIAATPYKHQVSAQMKAHRF